MAIAIGSLIGSKRWTLIYWLNVQSPLLPFTRILDWQGLVVSVHGSEKPNEWPSTELERLRGIDQLPARMQNGIRKFTAFHSVPTQFIAPELKTFRQTPRRMQNATRVSVVSLQFLR